MPVKSKPPEQQALHNDAMKMDAWIEAEVRKHCPAGGGFVSYTKTDIPDGKGGFIDAQAYARQLAFRKIAEKLGDPALEGKIWGFIRSGIEDEEKHVQGIGLERFGKVAELMRAMGDEARKLGNDVVANAVGLPGSTFASVYAERRGKAKAERESA